MHRANKSNVEILPTLDERNEYHIFGFKDISPRDSFSMHHFTKEDGSAFASVEDFEDYTANISVPSQKTTAPIDYTELLNAIKNAVTKPPLELENVTYSLVGAKNITFEAETINAYSMMIEKGQAKFKEVNETDYLDTNRGLSSSYDDRILPNEIKITNKDAESVTTISVIQLIGTTPLITDN